MNGGRVVAEAVPERLIGLAQSHTGAALKPVLSRVAAIGSTSRCLVTGVVWREAASQAMTVNVRLRPSAYRLAIFARKQSGLGLGYSVRRWTQKSGSARCVRTESAQARGSAGPFPALKSGMCSSHVEKLTGTSRPAFTSQDSGTSPSTERSSRQCSSQVKLPRDAS